MQKLKMDESVLTTSNYFYVSQKRSQTVELFLMLLLDVVMHVLINTDCELASLVYRYVQV